MGKRHSKHAPAPTTQHRPAHPERPRKVTIRPHLVHSGLDPIEYKVSIDSETSEPLKDLTIRISAGKHQTVVAVDLLQPYQKNVERSITLHSTSKRTIDNFPDKFTVSCMDFHGEWEESLDFRTQDWCRVQPKRSESLNILIFGTVGAGKSSFVQRALDMVNCQLPQHVPVGGDAKHVTKKLCKYTLTTNSSICMWDLWGVARDNFRETAAELPKILSGELPAGWNMDDFDRPQEDLAQDLRRIRKAAKTRFKREIHAMMFYIPYTLLEDPGMIADKRKIAAHFQTAQSLNPIVVIGRMDEGAKPTGSSLETLTNTAHQLFNIPKSRIFFNSNKEGWSPTQSKFDNQRNLYRIIDTLIRTAQAKELSCANVADGRKAGKVDDRGREWDFGSEDDTSDSEHEVHNYNAARAAKRQRTSGPTNNTSSHTHPVQEDYTASGFEKESCSSSDTE